MSYSICKCHGLIEFKCPNYGKEPEESKSPLPSELEGFYSDAVLAGIIQSLVIQLQNLDDERKTMIHSILENFLARLNEEARRFTDKYRAVERALESGNAEFKTIQGNDQQ